MIDLLYFLFCSNVNSTSQNIICFSILNIFIIQNIAQTEFPEKDGMLWNSINRFDSYIH